MTQSARRPLAVPKGSFSRMARLGAMTAGVAGSVALGGLRDLSQGRRPDTYALLTSPAAMSRITKDLARMRGAAMKLGQLLSMESGMLLPPEATSILSQLRDQAHVMPPRDLRIVLDRAWGPGWRKRFTRFDVRPLAAASIGQVHRATTPDGVPLAIKVQYPGVADSIDSDVKNLGGLLRASGLLPSGLDIAPYLDVARDQLHEETDYLREAAEMTRFAERLGNEEGFSVPRVHPEFTTRQVLAMTYLPGAPIESLATAQPALRTSVVSRLATLTLRELFDFGVMQSDPNFANFLYDAGSDRIVLLDFGATRHLDPEVTSAYRRAMVAGLNDNTGSLRAALTDLGVVSDTMPLPHVQAILHMCDLVFDALRSNTHHDFSDTALMEALHMESMKLARDGATPPAVHPDVLFIQRKLAGVALLATRLGATIPIADLLRPWRDPEAF